MAAFCATSPETNDFLSMMRTLASLSEAAKLRGDKQSDEIFASVAALLAEVHLAGVPASDEARADVNGSASPTALA